MPQDLIFDEAEFDHPVFDTAAFAAQPAIAALQGRRNTWFAGAHLGYGFHEDGLASAVRIAGAMGATIPWEVPAPDAAQQKRHPSSPRPALAGTLATELF
jgi:predicted NAD/FAD-binding protein